jgi:hypothetical protein
MSERNTGEENLFSQEVSFQHSIAYNDRVIPEWAVFYNADFFHCRKLKHICITL